MHGKEYIKVTIILMLTKDYPPESVSGCLGIDSSTVYRYWFHYREVGSDAFLENRHKRYWGMLSGEQICLLQAELRSNVHACSSSVVLWIRENFGVCYTKSGVVDLLNRIGFTCRKTKEVPCECDAEQQEPIASELSELFPCSDENTVIYYADGVHPTRNSRSTIRMDREG